MTIIDDRYEFSNATAVSVINSSSNEGALTDIVDQGSDMKDAFGTAIYNPGIGAQAKVPTVVCTIGTAVLGATSVIEMSIRSHTTASSWISNATTHVTTRFDAGAAAKDQISLPIPAKMNEFWGVAYKVLTANCTAGTVRAYMAEAAEQNEANPQ